jgi:hypothetical protein
MPDTILKRWNGSSFEELYPKTTVGQISASGTLSSSTFLRGDGQWQTPATQSHTHGNITNAGAIGSTSGLGIVTTTSGVLTTRSISDSTALTILDSASTNLVTERDVYFGVHYQYINVSAAIANSATFTTPIIFLIFIFFPCTQISNKSLLCHTLFLVTPPFIFRLIIVITHILFISNTPL